jgi:hypothetical protein
MAWFLVEEELCTALAGAGLGIFRRETAQHARRTLFLLSFGSFSTRKHYRPANYLIIIYFFDARP